MISVGVRLPNSARQQKILLLLTISALPSIKIQLKTIIKALFLQLSIGVLLDLYWRDIAVIVKEPAWRLGVAWKHCGRETRDEPTVLSIQ